MGSLLSAQIQATSLTFFRPKIWKNQSFSNFDNTRMKKMPLFSRPRSPAEIVRNLKEALNPLERGGDSKKQEKVRKNSSDLITYFVSQSRNLRKNSSSNGGTEDEETRKIRFFRQVWSCYIFFCNTF